MRLKDLPVSTWTIAPNPEYPDPCIFGKNCLITITRRPYYCDRGNFLAYLETDRGSRLSIELDAADSWPRYYFDLDRAKLECEAWIHKRKQWGAFEGRPSSMIINLFQIKICKGCDGIGRLYVDVQSLHGVEIKELVCGDCQGTGDR